MKAIQVRIRRGVVGEDMMVYPSRYNAEEVDRNGIGPLNVNQSGAYSGHIGNGGSEEWCIIILDDTLADEYALDDDMSLMLAADADALMEQWRVERNESEHIIRDAERLADIRDKEAARTPLTPEDLRALDPDDEMPGLNMRLRKVADVVARSGQVIA